MKQQVPINPALLRWARCAAGLSLKDAAARAKITALCRPKNQTSVTPEDRLASWEDGRTSPSISQLKALANAYRRPFVTFFLAEPPTEVAPLADYRTIPNTPVESPEFAALKRRIFQLHRELCAIAKEEQTEALPFVNSCNMEDGVPAVVDAIRRTLGIEPVEAHTHIADDAFHDLREKAQNAGVYVVLMGDLGNYHSRVEPDEFRGIAIAEQFAPLIVINSYDTKVARPFTLAHELAHIFLGFSGVSNQNAFELQRLHKSIEQFCNSVAAELLVPERSIRQAWNGQDGDLEQFIRRMARNLHVSEEVIARRLYDLGLIYEDDYRELVAFYRVRWEHNKKKIKDSGGGPNPNGLASYNLGKKTLETLLRAADNGSITLQDAARTVNMSVSRFEKVVEFC